MWAAILCVFLGSGIGGVVRYLTGVFMQTEAHGTAGWMLPWSTFVVNVAGCFIFGLVYGLSLAAGLTKEWKLALTTGFCGGLTTFSTFSYETLALISDGHLLQGTAYSLISLVTGVAAAWLGYTLVRITFN